MRYIRKTAAAVLLAAGMASSGLTAMPVRAEMLNMKDYNDDKVTVSKVPEGRAGQKITIRMTIHNTFEEDLKNVRISLVDEEDHRDIMDELFGSDDDDEDDEDEEGSGTAHVVDSRYPFEADSKTYDEHTIGDIKAGGTKTVSVAFKLRRDLPQGYYQAFFRLRSDGGRWGGGRYIGMNLWVKEAKSESETDESDETNNLDYDFVLGEGQATPYASYGEVMNFSVKLRNAGRKTAYGVRMDMQLDPDSAKFPLDINEGNYVRYPGDLAPGDTVEVPYSMAVRTDVKSGFYPIHFNLTYRESLEEEDDYSEPLDRVFYVHVRGKDDEDDGLSADAGEQERTKARIIVDGFSTEPAEVFAGKPFTLHLSMKNASDKIAASNIMLTLESEEVEGTPVFTAENGSNSAVINSLSPGASGEIRMNFAPAPTAAQKSYKLTIKEQYDSPEFKNAAAEVNIAIPVKQESRFTLGTIDVMPDAIPVGSESNVMFPVNNTGKVILYNVTAHFKADSIDPVDAYVGNIKPGESGNVDAMLTGLAPTMDDGKVLTVISYEDEYGQVTEVEKEISLLVTEAETENFDEMVPADMAETDGGKSGMILPAAGGGAALIALIAGLRIRKKKKRAKEQKELEDDIP